MLLNPHNPIHGIRLQDDQMLITIHHTFKVRHLLLLMILNHLVGIILCIQQQ